MESPVDGQDQPKIYTIRDHTLEVLMHPDVLELHAVRVVHTPHGDERQLHLKVRVRCGQEELVVDVLVDTGAQVSLVRRGLFKEESLQPSRRPVRLKVANGEAGSDPRGHLGVTWGVYLCAGKPPLADIILSHPPDLTRCDSVIGLAIPAMSGHIQNRGTASGDLYIRISGINRVLLS